MPDASPMDPRRGFGAGGATLAEVGERSLLDHLVAISSETFSTSLGSGDDAAVWVPPAGCDLATTVDALVEDVDFRRSWIGPHDLGVRAFRVAVSDLAAMGARPVNCVATMCARGSEQMEDVLEIQRGLCGAAAAVGCAVVGGDVSAIDGPLVVDVCVTGALPHGRALRRSAGRPGDLLVITGSVGRSAAGLRLLLDGDAPVSDIERAWVRTHLEPGLRLREGAALLDAGILCAGDVSDGLLVDAARTANASGCAAEVWVDALPVEPHLRERFSHDWLQLAIAGGEDFELLGAVAEPVLPALLSGWPAALAPLSVVGVLTAGTGLRLLQRRGGGQVSPPTSLAEHFA